MTSGVNSTPWLGQRPCIMGILNVTPDSFSDGGRYAAEQQAVAHALALAAQGADIIDVGGESTRPGARPVSVEDELERVIPVIERLAPRLSVPISIDTTKPEVMRAALDAGASIINDVNALQAPGALEVAAKRQVPVILMHRQGAPDTMQRDPQYGDVVAEVAEFLRERRAACVAAGLDADAVVLDPGIGFGKALEHNLALLRGVPTLAALGAPLLIGVSRKSMFAQLLGERTMDERLVPSVVAAVMAIQRGAAIVRVHDVAATRDALRVFAALN